MRSLFELWKSGAKMPFLVKHPDSGQMVAVTAYYWPDKFFVGEMNGTPITLTGTWQLWEFVREA